MKLHLLVAAIVSWLFWVFSVDDLGSSHFILSTVGGAFSNLGLKYLA